MRKRFYGFNNRFRTTKNTEAIVFENGGFVGMVDYLNINIIFLPVDILINVIYYHIKLIKDGLLVLQ